MKTYKSKLMTLIALGGLVAFAPLAKSETSDTKPERTAGRRAGAVQDRTKHIAGELQLNADQKEKLRPIFQEEAQKMRALRQDTNLSKQDKMAKLKTIREDARAKIKPILTAEQLEKWDKMREEAPKRHRRQ